MRYTEDTLPNEATRILNAMLQGLEFTRPWIEQAIASEKPIITLGDAIKEWTAEFLPSTGNDSFDALLRMASDQINYYEMAALWMNVDTRDFFQEDLLPKPDRDNAGMPTQIEEPEPEPKVILPTWVHRAIGNDDAMISLDFEVSVYSDDWFRRKFGGQVKAKIFVEFLESVEFTEEEELAGAAKELGAKIEIGWILGTYAKGISVEGLGAWDNLRSAAYSGFDWLLKCPDVSDDISWQRLVYVESVHLNEEWRGNEFSLHAVATYCDVLGAEFVFLYPNPFRAADMTPERSWNAKRKVKKHWEKLGLKDFNEGFLYGDWKCPEVLAGDPD